jgi:hypothetical protein
MTTTSPHAPMRRSKTAAAAVAATLVLSAACSGSVVHTYRTFQSAVDRGAGCKELFDQRARFENADTLAKVDAELQRIGCTSPDAKRSR